MSRRDPTTLSAEGRGCVDAGPPSREASRTGKARGPAAIPRTRWVSGRAQPNERELPDILALLPRGEVRGIAQAKLWIARAAEHAAAHDKLEMLRDIAPSDEASIKAYEELYGPGSYEPWTDEIHESQLREHARVLDSIGRKLETSALAASLRSHKHAADVGWAFEFVAHLAGPAIELMRLDPSLSASESTDRVLAGWRLPAGIPPELVLGQYDWRLVELVREELDRMGIAERLEGRVRLRALAFDVVCRFFDLKAPAVRRYLRQHQVGVSTTKCIKQLLPVRG